MTSSRPGSRLQTGRTQSPAKLSTGPAASSSSRAAAQRRGALFVDLVFADSTRVPPLQEDNWDLPGDYDDRMCRVPGAKTLTDAYIV